MLLDTYASLKRINKYKMKFKSKPWTTLGLQKSISVKNRLLLLNKKLKKNIRASSKKIKCYRMELFYRLLYKQML